MSTNIQFDNNGHDFIEFYEAVDVVMINGLKTVNLNEKDFTYYVTFNEKKYEMPLTINYAEPNNTESGAVEQNNTAEEPAPAQNETTPAESTTPTNTTTESEEVAEAVNVNEEVGSFSWVPDFFGNKKKDPKLMPPPTYEVNVKPSGIMKVTFSEVMDFPSDLKRILEDSDFF